MPSLSPSPAPSPSPSTQLHNNLDSRPLSPPFLPSHRYRSRPPQRDSLASILSSSSSTLPGYNESTPPEYESPSSSPARARTSLDGGKKSATVEDQEQGPLGRLSPLVLSLSADEEEEEDDDEDTEPDALDLLILRTSAILSTSESILDSTISSRAQLSRFFALDDTLHQRERSLRLGLEGNEEVESSLERLASEVEDFAEGRNSEDGWKRREREPEWRRDPRELLGRRGGRGHAPRVGTMYDAVESLPPRREEEQEQEEGEDPAPHAESAARSIAGTALGEPPPSPSAATPRTHRRTSSAARDSLLRNSASASFSLPTPTPTPPRLSSHSSATSLLSTLASSSPTTTLRRVTPLKPSVSTASLASILESTTTGTPSSSPAVNSIRRASTSTNATSPDLALSHSLEPRSILAIHEEETPAPSSLSHPSPPPQIRSPTPRSPSRIRPSTSSHTRASPSLSLSTGPLPASLFLSSPFPSPAVTQQPPRHRRFSSSASSNRPPPSPSLHSTTARGGGDLSLRVNAEATRGVGVGHHERKESGLKERLQAELGGGKEELKAGAGGGGGGWWWN